MSLQPGSATAAHWANLCELETAAADRHYSNLLGVYFASIPPELQSTGDARPPEKRPLGFTSAHRVFNFWLDFGQDAMPTCVIFKFSKRHSLWRMKNFVTYVGSIPMVQVYHSDTLPTALTIAREIFASQKAHADGLRVPTIDSMPTGRTV